MTRVSPLPSRRSFADRNLNRARPLALDPLEPRELLAVTVNHTPYPQLGDPPLAPYNNGFDQAEILWQTKPAAGTTSTSFNVDVRPNGSPTWTAVPTITTIDTGVGGRVNQSAVLRDLAFDSLYDYRVQHFEDA